MSTRSLIIGKSKEGGYVYGQCKFDGDWNYKWLTENLSEADKVEKFLQKLKRVGVSSLWYKRKGGNGLDRDMADKTKPFIEWMDYSYNCGTSKTKKAILDLVHKGHFDFPEAITYWDGKKWKKI